MNYTKKEFNYLYGNKTVTIETGRLAKQADGAVFVTCGGTQLLVTVVSAREMGEEQDFFPLLVDYKERFYAAGKFLGGVNKREARPSNAEILLMRMVDRPFRPLFPTGYFYETVVQSTVHSYESSSDPEVLAGLGAAAALAISDVPFNGPVGFCKVGRIDGQFVLNPGLDDWANSDIELVVAGTKDAILMVEGEADELPEEVLVDAIMYAHEHIKGYCNFVDEIVKAVGKPKREYKTVSVNQQILEMVRKNFEGEARKCLVVAEKLKRQNMVAEVETKVVAVVEADKAKYSLAEGDKVGKKVHMAVDEYMAELMRSDILNKGVRIGGRSLQQVRPISTEADVLKVVHGSSLFTRGETQVLASVTLGGKVGEQLADSVAGVHYERFYLHYTFAPYCVGEARGYRGVGRREIGHGNLAERALRKAMPSDDKFPYTVRIYCEVTESNGSSSMGSICSGSMALMDAGVPLKAPVAGVAMGLIKEGDKFVILTDILGDEDHLGDMDFKVAGTSKGFTAIQMDIKIAGVTKEIFQQALKQAREGRMHILSEMAQTISTHRKSFKPGVPQIYSTTVAPDKIGALIGPSGKNIKALQEEYQVTIEVEDSGRVRVVGTDSVRATAALATIDLQMNGPALNSEYEGEVVSIKEYGAFVDLAANVSGLLHVSELCNERVKNVEDYLSVGDKVKVKVVEIDRYGKVKLSAKAIQSLPKKTTSK